MAVERDTPPRPRVDVLLALPRPKVLKRMWAQLASLGVGQIILTNASRVERDYFDTHVLTEACYRPLLIEGLQRLRRTEEAEVFLRRFLAIKELPDSLRRDRARLLERQGMWAQAAEDWRTLARAGDASDPGDAVSYAWAMARAGRPDEAQAVLDRAAELAMALRILINAKCQRPGVCNAAESLLVHADVAETFLPQAAEALTERVGRRVPLPAAVGNVLRRHRCRAFGTRTCLNDRERAYVVLRGGHGADRVWCTEFPNGSESSSITGGRASSFALGICGVQRRTHTSGHPAGK